MTTTGRPSAGRLDGLRRDSLPLGAGRSGVVYHERTPAGREVARKVFESDALTKLVQVAFLGAPNPYSWNRSAVECAFLRRRILAPLVQYWFGDKLRVAQALEVGWDAERRSYSLVSEYIDGGPPTLHHPENRRGAREVEDLWLFVMKPLSGFLEESGFAGLAWQAGRGNPVALANFLRVAGTDRRSRWVWIDLESGVPALFPLDVRELARFYLPLARRLGRPPFDDVDVVQARAYVEERRAGLRACLGEDVVARITRDLDELEFHQDAWKSQPVHERAIRYRLARGRIDEATARHYVKRPLAWWSRELSRAPWRVARGLADRARRGWGRLCAIPWKRITLGSGAFLVSQGFRSRIARTFVDRRISSWERRGQLLPSEARRLRDQLERAEASEYLTDFGVHVAIKPVVKIVEYVFFGAFLYGSGRIDEATLTLAVLAGGPLARTLYTLGRLFQAACTRRELPWIALATGAIPVVGNLAYALQIVSSSRDEEGFVAQFILYDACSTIGRRLPVWGGPDTLIEHAFNHVPDRVIRSG